MVTYPLEPSKKWLSTRFYLFVKGTREVFQQAVRFAGTGIIYLYLLTKRLGEQLPGTTRAPAYA